MAGKGQVSPITVAAGCVPLGAGIIVSALVGDAMWFFIALGIACIVVPILVVTEKNNERRQ
jgi:hypothetical protein